MESMDWSQGNGAVRSNAAFYKNGWMADPAFARLPFGQDSAMTPEMVKIVDLYRICDVLARRAAMIVIIVFLMADDKETMRPMMFVGIGLALGSLILRNVLRFKPEWFKDGNENK